MEENRTNNQRQVDDSGQWIAIGVGIGTALGVALDNIAVGVALGAAIGMALSFGLGQSCGINQHDQRQQ